MMKHEFEALAGYEVTWNDYKDIIEPMYMATTLNKQDFVKVVDKKRFALPTKAQMQRSMKRIAKHLFEICGHTVDYEAEHELEALAHKYAERFYGLNWASDLNAYCFINKGYEFEELRRGCTYPKELVIGRAGNGEFERITLV